MERALGAEWMGGAVDPATRHVPPWGPRLATCWKEGIRNQKPSRARW